MKIWKYRQLADWFYKRPALADVNWKNPTIRSNYWQSTTKASKTSWTVALTHSLTAGHLSTLRSFLFWPATMKRHSFMGVGKLVKLITTRLSYIHIIGQIQSKFKEPTRGGKPLFIRFVRGGERPHKVGSKRECVCVCVWRGGVVNFHSRWYKFHNLSMMGHICVDGVAANSIQTLWPPKKQVEFESLLEHDQCNAKQSSITFGPHSSDDLYLCMLSSSTPFESVWASKCLKIPANILWTSTKSLLLCWIGQNMKVYPKGTSKRIENLYWISFPHYICTYSSPKSMSTFYG